jgi:hypothetical protein
MSAADRIDFYARRAGEEFIAASRAPCPDARARHRRRAIDYVALLRECREPTTSQVAA